MPSTSAAERIVLVDPSPEYKQRYQEERLRIALALGHIAAAIEHIGSTAIAGIKTKPIVDILIGLRGEPLSAVIASLTSLGYEHVEGAGGEGRLHFSKAPDRTHHVHVVLHDGAEWRRHIIFRDWLNLHPALAKEYEALKIDLSARFPDDRAAYTEGKTPFVERVLGEAARFPALRLKKS
jgi:GrpB-like predicted nucleotidyltransferase (UPF0157 family)